MMSAHRLSSVSPPAALIDSAVRWIHGLRDDLLTGSRTLTAAERVLFAPHFPVAVLRSVRIAVVDAVASPALSDAARASRLDRLLDFSDLEALTLVDTIVLVRAGMPAPAHIMSLLFHELVHVTQFRQVGCVGFVDRYLHDWLASRYDYGAIRAERQAFALESRFTRRPGRSVPVARLVSRAMC
ncbi:MAG: hypothetical protein ACE5IK_12645 [Acidobacteriota bacterium]